ncbi:MAG: type II CRISPR-associated endonuclease Cas1 [Paludibacteraceae bacterium]|nr:type II CRISPR-associated endonuclease Cas1 [Paludibacteraceae bacterium]MBO7315655.1 type II CRISPR-associated endonuclease Cas1 [Paludibacteraceae bacterium]
MIKRTLYFGNPAYLSTKYAQLEIRLPEVEKNKNLPESFKATAIKQIPIEDIGVVILDNKQITITQGALSALLENNVAVISCNEHRMPSGLMLPLAYNTTQSERFRHQIEASLPLKKQLWQQTIQAKIANQSAVLLLQRGLVCGNMEAWIKRVKSGDSENLEGRAAVYYWQNLFGHINGFNRDREGIPPNNLLNYGYAILRAVVARSLVSSGLLPTLGIHHHNRYNAYCLADDIMEPYRPYVDKLVAEIVDSGIDCSTLTTEIKSELLSIPVTDVVINGRRSPLMIGVGITTASLYKCYSGELRKIAYPTMKND